MNFLMGLLTFCFLIHGFSINRSIKKVFLKIHKTFKESVHEN